MDNSIYIALSKELGLFRKMDVVANNIANANTTGYKAEDMLFQDFVVDAGRHNKISFANDVATTMNESQGALMKTGRSLDAAIQGDGYFKVETPQGVRYTRAGNFRTDIEGNLVTQQGQFVLDAGDQPIAFQQGDTNVIIREDGTITVGDNNEQRGQLGLVTFANKQLFEKLGNSLLAHPDNPQPAENFTLAQGMVEQSNVNSVSEMTKMIGVSRAVGSTHRVLVDVHELQMEAMTTIARQR